MNSLHAPVAIKYANKLIEETIRTKLLGMYIDNQANWNKHIDKFRPKLRTASFAVKMLFHIICIDVLRMVTLHISILYKIWNNILGKFNQYMSCVYITNKKN